MKGVLAVYVTHPQVEMDPRVPVPDWGLSPLGRARAAWLAAGCPPDPSLDALLAGDLS